MAGLTAPAVLVLLGPSAWEGPFVAALAHPASGVAIARRCLDTADLLAACEAGLGRVALVGADAPRLDVAEQDAERAVAAARSGDVDLVRVGG